MELPDFDKMRREQHLTPDEIRAKWKREGELPPRTFQERPLLYASTRTYCQINYLFKQHTEKQHT